MPKICLLSALASLLVLAAISITAVQSSHAVVESTCASTLYPDLCVSTINEAALSPASIESSKDVLLTALSSTIYTVERNYFTIKKIGATRRNSPTLREKTALHDCLELTALTLEHLRVCELELKDFGLKNYSLADHKDNLMTYLSAAQTNQGTCLDGFSHDKADKKLRQALVAGHEHVFRLLSNVLAIVKKLADTENGVDSSFLKKFEESGVEEWPEWLSEENRRVLQAEAVANDVTVAADGSGNYRTVGEAVAAAPSNSNKRYVIKIKAGVYKENVVISSQKTNLMFVGDGRLNTTITGNRNVASGLWDTYNTATVAVQAIGFLARDVTFENTAGPEGDQAVALRVTADKTAFYRCSIIAYQDTLYVHSLRQFYTNCFIAGTIDFIFGNAVVVIQNSDLRARRPLLGQRNMFTAQGREDPNQNTGIVIQKSKISADKDLEAVLSQFRSYLGRPWRKYSRTVVMQNEITNVIHPAGWHEWTGSFALDTLFYAEYNNTGEGADTSHRVNWKGYHIFTNLSRAQPFTARNFIFGGSWLPDTGFPYTLGL